MTLKEVTIICPRYSSPIPVLEEGLLKKCQVLEVAGEVG
jgi:hypothetical protein